MHDDVVLHSDFQRLDAARWQIEAVLHRDVFADSADAVVRFEVAGVVLGCKRGADYRRSGIVVSCIGVLRDVPDDYGVIV